MLNLNKYGLHPDVINDIIIHSSATANKIQLLILEELQEINNKLGSKVAEPVKEVWEQIEPLPILEAIKNIEEPKVKETIDLPGLKYADLIKIAREANLKPARNIKISDLRELLNDNGINIT